jgi:hypothetical protein
MFRYNVTNLETTERYPGVEAESPVRAVRKVRGLPEFPTLSDPNTLSANEHKSGDETWWEVTHRGDDPARSPPRARCVHNRLD